MYANCTLVLVFFQNCIGLTATQMTVELLKNNKVLVQRITKLHIERICSLTRNNMVSIRVTKINLYTMVAIIFQNYRYLELLGTLCVVDGAALSRNQNYIASELIENVRRKEESIFLMTELGQNVGRRKNVVYISWDDGKGWQVLHDFTSLVRSASTVSTSGSP